MELYRTYQVTASGPDAHHDALLSNLAVAAFSTGVDEFVADQIFPNVNVGKQSDRYAILNKGNFLRLTQNGALRAPKTEARRVEFEVSSDAYFADNYALAGDLALEDLANQDNVFRLRQNTIMLITSVLRREQEIRIANTVTSMSNLGSATTLSGTSQWNDYVNSDPMGDVSTAHAFIENNTGLKANTMVVDKDTYRILRRHPDILDLYKYTAGGQATSDQIKDVFEVDNMIVARGIKENSLEGGTASITNIWGNNCLLAHIEPATGVNTRTLGLRFQWRPAGFAAPFVVGTKRESGPGTANIEIIETGHFQDEKIIAADLGYLIASTIS